jgi:hypothetical protein
MTRQSGHTGSVTPDRCGDSWRRRPGESGPGHRAACHQKRACHPHRDGRRSEDALQLCYRMASDSDVGLHRSSCRIVVVAGAGDGTNRAAGRVRTFRRVCRVSRDCGGRLRDEVGRCAHYRLLLALRRPAGIPSTFLARQTPRYSGFRNVLLRGFVRRNWRQPPLGASLRCAAVIGGGFPSVRTAGVIAQPETGSMFDV